MPEPVQDQGRRPAPPDPDSLDVKQRARRDRIVAAAVELMVRYDHDGVQMKDVTAAAGVALGTMYRYFNSKEHLFAEALVVWSDRYREVVVPPRSGSSADRLKIAYRGAVRGFARYPSVYGHMLAVQATTDPVAADVFQRFVTRQNEAFARFLPRVPSPRREQVVAVMGAVLDVNVREWVLGRQPIGAVYEAVDSAAELLLG